MGKKINRRQFLKSGVAASVAAGFTRPAQGQNTAKPPNILYIFSDQHRASAVQALGAGASGEGADLYTPNLNAFRSSGFTMQNCYSNYPLCSPHRAMVQTGVWPQSNGVTGNVIVNASTTVQNNVANLNTNNTGLAQVLKSAAVPYPYHTGYVGKWDLYADGNYPSGYLTSGDPNRFGYDEWMAWFNVNNHYVGGSANPSNGTVPSPSNSAYTYGTSGSYLGKPQFVYPYSNSPALGTWNPHCQTQQAIDFIKNNEGGTQPWMLIVSYNVPHPPYNAPNGAAPAKPSNGYYHYTESKVPSFRSNVDVGASTAPGSSGTVYNVPDASLNQVRSSNDPETYLDPTQNGANYLEGKLDTGNGPSAQGATWNYYEGISDIDGEIALLLAQVANDTNTIVIYTSDHGDMMCSHTLAGKQYPQEESSHVPFYVGGKVNGTAISGSYSGLFSSIDIFPTICGLAGVTPPAYVNGKNFAPVITGQATEISNPNQYVFLLNGHGDPNNGNGGDEFDGYLAAPVYRGVRTSRYTYACVATSNLSYFRSTTNHTNVGPYNGGHWLLFDNLLDPYQQNNLIVNGVYPAGTANQPVPNWADISAVLAGFIHANGGGSYGNDAFVSTVPQVTLAPSQTAPIKLGQPVTIVVQVAAINPKSGSATPTGAIVYSVDSGTASTAVLSPGGSVGTATASFTLSGLSLLFHTISVNYAGDANYAAAPATITMNGNVPQSILFPPLPDVTLSAIQSIALSARTTSGQPVTYTVIGPATLNPASSTLALTGTGTVSVTASAAGNSSFSSAATVTRTFSVH